MKRILYNRENEKILTILSVSNFTVSCLFNAPNFYGVFFFSKANALITLDQREISVKNNDIIFYYPYQKMVFEGSFEATFIQFHPDFFCIDIHVKDVGCQGVLFNNFFDDTLLRCSKNEFDNLYESCYSIQKELLERHIGQLDMVSSLLKMFLIKAVRVKKEKQEITYNEKENLHYQIEKLIDDNYKKESSPEFYAGALNVSLTTFNRLCKKFFKNSFITVLNLKRIASAKNTLFLTNSPIKDIAYDVGYNDPLYFTRVFKKYTGISPKGFRNQLQNNRLL